MINEPTDRTTHPTLANQATTLNPLATVDALYVPQPSDAYVPPLDIARRLAREDLAEQQSVSIHDHMAMVRAATKLEIRLRQLLDALDADGTAVAS